MKIPKFTKWRKHGEVILDVGAPGEWDDYRVALPDVLIGRAGGASGRPEGYKMYYSGCDRSGRWSIGLATSPDGVKFTKHPANPLLRTGTCAWDEKEVAFSSTLKEGDTYKMWFGMREGPPNAFYYLGYAESEDGITWRRRPEPILGPGPRGSVDDRGILRPAVVREGNGYRMIYASLDMEWGMQLCLATSPDGLRWEKCENNPIVRPGPAKWDEVRIEDPHLIVLEGKYYLTYCGWDKEGKYRLGLAISEDGEHFEKLPDPILDVGPSGSFDEVFVAGSYIICAGGASGRKVDEGWRMYYHGRDAELPERMSVAYLVE